MFKTLSNLLLACLLMYSCGKNDHAELEKLSRENILALHEAEQWSLKNSVFLNEEKNEASAKDIERFANGLVSADYYANKEGIIKKTVFRPTTYQDKITYILIKNIDYHPADGIPYIDVNCDSLYVLIESCYRNQEALPGISTVVTDTMSVFDHSRVILASIEKDCGLPSLEQHGKKVVKDYWDIIHHNEKEVIAYYYSYIEKLVQDGHIHPEKLALSADRLLMNYGYKQVYGSQIVNSKLYPIENPDSVNIRRAAIELEPLADYLEVYGLEW
ncbi:MAG: DUF6624 domain-containing protein [Bacteroidota bacterium]